MKSDKEIEEIVKKAKAVVKGMYEDDERLKNPKNQVPNSGVTVEMNVVFQEVLRHMLNS
jgi:hypothetical protein